MLSHNPFLEVIGAARNGLEALELTEALRPDVITSDLVMPELDGVGFITQQMLRRPVPIVVMSSLDDDGPEVLAALDAGAVDFVQKPTALATEKMFDVRGKLIETIKTVAKARPEKLIRSEQVEHFARPPIEYPRRAETRFDAVVIGVSTGGPQALRYMIPLLSPDFPVPILMVMHMPVGYTAMYAEKLNEISQLTVAQAAGGEEIEPGTAFLAPAGKHLAFKRMANGSVLTRLTLRPHDTPHRPSVDVMFESASAVFGQRVLGLVMTGMGTDGRAGATHIKANGGVIFAEAEESCIVFGMPGAVVDAGLADRVIRLEDMAQALTEAV